VHLAVFQGSVARATSRRVLRCYNRDRTETSESLSHEPRARQFSAVLVLGRIREWDCARGGGFDRLNVFTPAAKLLHAIPAPANGPAARLIS
jgi:hypothetical protein